MEWMNTFVKAINFIEENLLEDISVEDISRNVNISSFYFQKAFQIFTGITVTEYIKGRRLYLAACELRTNKSKIIDCAYKYCYETPESFTKAYTRFHGCTPSATIKTGQIKVFLPLKIKVEITGGYDMDFSIEKIESFKMIGFAKDIPCDKGKEMCPIFWDEIKNKYVSHLDDKSEISNAIIENGIGEFGVCIDDKTAPDGFFRYMIGGIYKGGNIPKGMEIKEFKTMDWAKFIAIGPLPGALQALTTKIWQEWVPNCTKYELLENCSLEWYSKGDITKADYKSGVWLPIKEK